MRSPLDYLATAVLAAGAVATYAIGSAALSAVLAVLGVMDATWVTIRRRGVTRG